MNDILQNETPPKALFTSPDSNCWEVAWALGNYLE